MKKTTTKSKSGSHKMPNGKMMSDSAHKKMHEKKESQAMKKMERKRGYKS